MDKPPFPPNAGHLYYEMIARWNWHLGMSLICTLGLGTGLVVFCLFSY